MTTYRFKASRLSLLLALASLGTSSSALAQAPTPPPLPAGASSPYDALLPFATPVPTDGLVFHWDGGPPCDGGIEGSGCQGVDGIQWGGAEGEAFEAPFVGGRGRVMQFDMANWPQLLINEKRKVMEIRYEPDLLPMNRRPGLTVAFWYRAPGGPAAAVETGLNPLFSFGTTVPRLAIVLEDGRPIVKVGTAVNTNEPIALFGGNSLLEENNRLDDGQWHHVALALQTLCGFTTVGATACVHGDRKIEAVVRLFVDGVLAHEEATRIVVDLDTQALGYTRYSLGPFFVGALSLPWDDTKPRQSNDIAATQPIPGGGAVLRTIGLLDDVFVFSRSLSNEEVHQLRDKAEVGMRWLLAADTMHIYDTDTQVVGQPPTVAVTRPDGYSPPASTFKALDTSGIIDVTNPLSIADASSRMSIAHGLSSNHTFTVLGWVKPAPQTSSSFSPGRLPGTDSSSVTQLSLSPQATLTCFHPDGTQTTAVAPGKWPNGYADGSRTWQLVGIENQYGMERARVAGRPLWAEDGPYKQGIPAIACSAPDLPAAASPEQATEAFEIYGGGEHVAWIAWFDRILTRSEQLAWGAPGPSLWFSQDFSAGAAAAPTLRVHTDRGIVGEYYNDASQLCIDSLCPATLPEGYGGTASSAAAWWPAPSAGAMGLRFDVSDSELGAEPAVDAPYTVSVRFETRSTGPGTRTVTLARRGGIMFINGGYLQSDDLTVALVCDANDCDHLVVHSGSGTQRQWRVDDINLAHGQTHLVTVSFRDDWSYEGHSTTGSEPRIAIDGELMNHPVGSAGWRVKNDGGIFDITSPPVPFPLFYLPKGGHTTWSFGRHNDGSESAGSPVEVKVVEGRVYGREIETVDAIGMSCEPRQVRDGNGHPALDDNGDPITSPRCGLRECHGLATLSDHTKVGSYSCGDCLPSAYPIAHAPDGRGSECRAKKKFEEVCDTSPECEHGLCGGYHLTPRICLGPSPAVAQPDDLAALKEACRSKGRKYRSNLRQCWECETGFVRAHGMEATSVSDPGLLCLPEANRGPGEVCTSDFQCESQLCVYYTLENYTGTPRRNVETHSRTCTDGINCVFHSPSSSDDYSWKTVIPSATYDYGTAYRCAEDTPKACEIRGLSATEVHRHPKFGDQTSLPSSPTATGYRCGSGSQVCATNYAKRWTAMDPNFCMKMHSIARQYGFDLVPGETTTASGAPNYNICSPKYYDPYDDCDGKDNVYPTFTYQHQLSSPGGPKIDHVINKHNPTVVESMDLLCTIASLLPGKPGSIMPPDCWSNVTYQSQRSTILNELRRRGVGSLLLEYILANSTVRSTMSASLGRFFPLAECAADFPTASSASVFHSGKNQRVCDIDPKDNGEVCPPAGVDNDYQLDGPVTDVTVVRPDPVGHRWCDSGYCRPDVGLAGATATGHKTCQLGGGVLAETAADTANSHGDSDSDKSVKFGIVRCDDTTLEITPQCPPSGGGGGGQTSCSDGIDNDGDNLVDAADPDCMLPAGEVSAACAAGATTQAATDTTQKPRKLTMDFSQSHSACMFGIQLPPFPLFETDVHVEQSNFEPCGGSGLNMKVFGILQPVVARPLASCEVAISGTCLAVPGGDVALDPNATRLGSNPPAAWTGEAECNVFPEDFLTDAAQTVLGSLANPAGAFASGTGKVCIPLPKSLTECPPPVGGGSTFVFCKLFTAFGIPLTVKVAPIVDACIEARMGPKFDVDANEDDYTVPSIEVKPVLALGVEARAGVGITNGAIDFWAGVKLELILASIGFPITWQPSLTVKEYTDDGTQKFVLDVSLKTAIDMELEMLAGNFALFAELGVGPFSVEKELVLFEWSGLKIVTRLLEKNSGLFTVDFDFDPGFTYGTQTLSTCTGQCN